MTTAIPLTNEPGAPRSTAARGKPRPSAADKGGGAGRSQPAHSSQGERRRETERKLTVHMATYRRAHASDADGVESEDDRAAPLDTASGTR